MFSPKNNSVFTIPVPKKVHDAIGRYYGNWAASKQGKKWRKHQDLVHIDEECQKTKFGFTAVAGTFVLHRLKSGICYVTHAKLYPEYEERDINDPWRSKEK